MKATILSNKVKTFRAGRLLLCNPQRAGRFSVILNGHKKIINIDIYLLYSVTICFLFIISIYEIRKLNVLFSNFLIFFEIDILTKKSLTGIYLV